jgi:acyl-CoA reductase-like NAD-dependent aldehyde dehydrogenase
MEFLQQLAIQSSQSGNATGSTWIKSSGKKIDSFSPVDGQLIGAVVEADDAAYEHIIQQAQQAWLIWRNWPAPRRGEIVRQVGEALRNNGTKRKFLRTWGWRAVGSPKEGDGVQLSNEHRHIAEEIKI